MSHILGRAILSAGILITLFLIVYILSFVYAGSQMGYMQGRGISVSEYAEGYHWVTLRATGVGFIALISIVLIWMVRFANLTNDLQYLKSHEKPINLSIFLYPILFALMFVNVMSFYVILYRFGLI